MKTQNNGIILCFLDLIAHLRVKIEWNFKEIIRDWIANLHEKFKAAVRNVQNWKPKWLIMEVD